MKNILLLNGGGVGSRPSAKREPLPPTPKATQTRTSAVWTKSPPSDTLPMKPPVGPTLDFHRGNFYPTIPGISFFERDSNKNPTMTATWFAPAREEGEWKTIFEHYANVCRYTHYVLSIPQAKNCGVSKETLKRHAQMAKSYGLFVVMVAGDGNQLDSELLLWLDYLRDVIDIICVCWQADKWYSPTDLLRFIWDLAKTYGDKPLSIHWINGACAWWDGDTCALYGICDRFDFQRQVKEIRWHYIQMDTEAPVYDEVLGGLQWSIGDAIRTFTSQKGVWTEYDTQAEFDQVDFPPRTEVQGDQKGYLGMCTQREGHIVEGGYLGGARMPDGSVL